MPGNTSEIIVIGASAGGIEVLLRLLRDLPRDLSASVFVTVHQGPRQAHLADVLGRNGTMPTAYAEEAGPISRQRIYVAPPNYHLTLRNSQTRLTLGPTVNRHRPAIDPLFESAAQEYGNRVVGVLLSGYQDDGTAGLAAIKSRGGIAVVQDPDEASAPCMPRSALRQVKVDYCVPGAEIAPLLVKLVSNTRKNSRK